MKVSRENAKRLDRCSSGLALGLALTEVASSLSSSVAMMTVDSCQKIMMMFISYLCGGK